MIQLTEKIRRIQLRNGRQSCNNSGTGDAAHSKQWDEGNLRLLLQLKIPDQGSRQQSEGEISNDTENAVNVSEGNDDEVGDASPIHEALLPEVSDGVALEKCNKEKGRAGDGRNSHGSVDDPGVYALDGDAQKEAADRDLGQDHGATVKEVAVEPALSCLLDTQCLEVPVMTASSILHSYCRGNTITDEEKLPVVSIHFCMRSLSSLTVDATMSQSSTPNAFTIFTRTMHRKAFARNAVAIKATLTPISSGPRLGIAMMLSGGCCLSHGR